MTKILDKQKENAMQLIIPDGTTSIVYQPVLLFCFLIWGKPNGPYLQAFMATILPVHSVQCLQLVDICVLRNVSWFLCVVSSLIFQQHYECWGWSYMMWDCCMWGVVEDWGKSGCGLFGGVIAEFAWLHWRRTCQISSVQTVPQPKFKPCTLWVQVKYVTGLTDMWGYMVAHLVQALFYKPEGLGFDSWWRDWNFSLT